MSVTNGLKRSTGELAFFYSSLIISGILKKRLQQSISRPTETPKILLKEFMENSRIHGEIFKRISEEILEENSGETKKFQGKIFKEYLDKYQKELLRK